MTEEELQSHAQRPVFVVLIMLRIERGKVVASYEPYRIMSVSLYDATAVMTILWRKAACSQLVWPKAESCGNDGRGLYSISVNR